MTFVRTATCTGCALSPEVAPRRSLLYVLTATEFCWPLFESRVRAGRTGHINSLKIHCKLTASCFQIRRRARRCSTEFLWHEFQNKNSYRKGNIPNFRENTISRCVKLLHAKQGTRANIKSVLIFRSHKRSS